LCLRPGRRSWRGAHSHASALRLGVSCGRRDHARRRSYWPASLRRRRSTASASARTSQDRAASRVRWCLGMRSAAPAGPGPDAHEGRISRAGGCGRRSLAAGDTVRQPAESTGYLLSRGAKTDPSRTRGACRSAVLPSVSAESKAVSPQTLRSKYRTAFPPPGSTAAPTSTNPIPAWNASEPGFGGSELTSQTTRTCPAARAASNSAS